MSAADGELLKVFMITYNHEAFVSEAVESVMMQRTDLPVLLVIGEDKSTDGTRAIVQELAGRYPDRIKLILHETNLGASRTGFDVWEECLKESSYVAIIEGDDLWIDPLKLQKQVDVLRANGEVSMCFHNAWNQQPDGSRSDYVRAWLGKEKVDHRFTTADIIACNCIPTVSICLRNTPQLKLLERLKDRPFLDYTINIVLAEQGPLAYIDEPMGIRRMHAGGMMSMQAQQYKIDYNLDLLPHLDALSRYRHSTRLAIRRKELLDTGFQAAVGARDLSMARSRWKRMWRERNAAHYALRELARNFVIAYLPAVAGWVARRRMA
ncbi:MAG: glycosyltransferase [Flavobacteriales bacterium]